MGMDNYVYTFYGFVIHDISESDKEEICDESYYRKPDNQFIARAKDKQYICVKYIISCENVDNNPEKFYHECEFLNDTEIQNASILREQIQIKYPSVKLSSIRLITYTDCF